MLNEFVLAELSVSAKVVSWCTSANAASFVSYGAFHGKLSRSSLAKSTTKSSSLMKSRPPSGTGSSIVGRVGWGLPPVAMPRRYMLGIGESEVFDEADFEGRKLQDTFLRLIRVH
jgi:hypothetical protein